MTVDEKDFQIRKVENGKEVKMYPYSKSRNITFEDGKTLQEKLDNGELGGEAAGDISAHTNNKTIHITAEERTKWNAAEQNAKTYAEELVDSLVDTAPEALDTLKELSDALGNDPNFATTVATEIGKKSDKGHKHTKSEITDFPTSLPANGGNADTLDGLHADDFVKASGGTMRGTLSVSGANINATNGNFYTNQYVQLEARAGYGAGNASLWYDSVNNTKVLHANNVADLVLDNNKVYHEGRKPSWTDIQSRPETLPPSPHNHDASYLKTTGGVISSSAATNLTVKRDGSTANNNICFDGNGNKNYLGVSNGVLKYGNVEDLGGAGYSVYHSGNKPTPADIGAAAVSHGTHVSYGTTTGGLTAGASGTTGSSASVSRADHTHALPAYPTLSSLGALSTSGGTVSGKTTFSDYVSLGASEQNSFTKNSIMLYDGTGGTKYGVGLWNSNGTAGDWSTMIFGPSQANRRISFGKVNTETPTNHSHITEGAYFDLDDWNLNFNSGGVVRRTHGAGLTINNGSARTIVSSSGTIGEHIFGGNNNGTETITDYVRIGPNKLQYTSGGSSNNIYHTGNKPSPAEIGAFGKQGEVGAGHQWNDLVTAGCYKVQIGTWGAASLNGPNANFGSIYSYGLLVVFQTNVASEDRIMQIYYPHRTDQPVVQRMRNAGGWQAWAKIGRGLSASDVGAIPTSASCNKNWNWSGQGGQPPWLWGGSDGTNMYVYDPRNFSVNWANGAGHVNVGMNNSGVYQGNGDGASLTTANLFINSWYGVGFRGMAGNAHGDGAINTYINCRNGDVGTRGAFITNSGFVMGGMRLHSEWRQGQSDCLRINTHKGFLVVGPQNDGHCHYETDRPNHWFNKQISVAGNIETYNDENVWGLHTYRGGNYCRLANGNTTSALRVELMGQNSNYLFSTSTFYPNNSQTLGASSGLNRWGQIYSTSGSISTSDSRLKENIKPVEKTRAVRALSTEPTGEDMWNYVKNTNVYTFNYKAKYNSDTQPWLGVLADEVPDNIFDKIGMVSKTQEKYEEELVKQEEYKKAFEEEMAKIPSALTLEEEDKYDIDGEYGNKIIEGIGLTRRELKEESERLVEEPIRMLNSSAQIAMLQEVLSMALVEIENLKREIETIKNEKV